VGANQIISIGNGFCSPGKFGQANVAQKLS